MCDKCLTVLVDGDIQYLNMEGTGFQIFEPVVVGFFDTGVC